MSYIFVTLLFCIITNKEFLISLSFIILLSITIFLHIKFCLFKDTVKYWYERLYYFLLWMGDGLLLLSGFWILFFGDSGPFQRFWDSMISTTTFYLILQKTVDVSPSQLYQSLICICFLLLSSLQSSMITMIWH